MKKNQAIELILSLILFVVTFFNLFLPNAQLQKNLLTIFLIIYTILVIKLINFQKVGNINKKKIVILILGLSFIHVFFLYLIGIYVGFYKNTNSFSRIRFFNTILPYITIVICSEIIRQIFIIKEKKSHLIILTTGLILAEITTYLAQYQIETLNETLILIGYVSFPAISTNLLCNYIIKRYGLIPNLIYRIITTIYIYLFPLLPNIYIFFQSIYRIIYPYIIYIILDGFFEKSTFKKVTKNKKISFISLFISIVFVTSIVMLISCKFRYGILVVGSSSMAGTINKGDAVVFEQYHKQSLEKGQIIVFVKDNIKTIHCIEAIQIKNNETIYYTKGTNNQQQDEGYRTNQDIIGIVKFKIPGIGWPTIWLNDLFEP